MSKNGTPGTKLNVGKFLCTKCQNGECQNCIDLKRAAYTREKICQCPKHKTPSKTQQP